MSEGPSQTSSGVTPSRYGVPVRSANAAVVKFSKAPSERGNTRFDVVSPRVIAPNKRVDERPRNAIAIASPELAVVGPTVLRVGADADRTYLRQWSAALGVSDLLERALADADE